MCCLGQDISCLRGGIRERKISFALCKAGKKRPFLGRWQGKQSEPVRKIPDSSDLQGCFEDFRVCAAGGRGGLRKLNGLPEGVGCGV